MAVQRPETKLVKLGGRRETKRLRDLLFDTETSLTFTPLQVLIMSFSFIFIVFVLHILVKIFPTTSPIQLCVAIAVLCVSIGTSVYLNKK